MVREPEHTRAELAGGPRGCECMPGKFEGVDANNASSRDTAGLPPTLLASLAPVNKASVAAAAPVAAVGCVAAVPSVISGDGGFAAPHIHRHLQSIVPCVQGSTLDPSSSAW